MTADPLTVADIMEKKSGDCTEHALLFVTLARALGIPAREVSGIYYADELGGFSELIGPIAEVYEMIFEPSFIVADADDVVTARLDFTFDRSEMAAALATVT